MLNEIPAELEARRRRNLLIGILITVACLLVSLTFTFLFFKGMEGPASLSTNILVVTLINVDTILGVLLCLLLSRNLIKLYFERRNRLIGSGFRTKLVAAFVGFSLIPAFLLFFAASGYLTTSIDNWFGIQVEHPVNNALEIARSYYQDRQNTVVHFGRLLSTALTEEGLWQQTDSALGDILRKKAEAYRLERITVYGSDLKQRVSATGIPAPASPIVKVSDDFLKKALQGEEIKAATQPEEDRLVRAIFPVRASPPSSAILGALVIESSMPEALVSRMDEIKQSFEDYQQLKAFKNPIKMSYLVIFFSITLVILFSATWFGFYLAKRITVPITKLAEGTQAVAQGNLNFHIQVKANDEIGMLVDSFNKMTTDLKAGKTQLEEVNLSLSESNIEINQRRAHMETILEHIATGVIALDAQGRITNCNRSAERILSLKPYEILDKTARDAFQSRRLDPLITLLDKFKRSRKDGLEEEIHLEVMKKPLTLRFNLSVLKDPEGSSLGVVMVFEDLSELLKAQKLAAWQEVAQRIAHEIKNPLTPIQLSTERLRKKFFEHSKDFDGIFDEATTTIINEVNSLKKLVDEFSNFARFPSPRPSPQNLYEILNEVIRLYKAAHRDVIFETQYEKDFPMLMLDREQWKRAFVNIFENAVEAMNGGGRLVISTQYDPKQHRVRLEVSDDGGGIDSEDFDKLFLPYFSRKKSGTGLGLAIVNRIVNDHNGQIRITSNIPQGATVIIELPAMQT
jgi:two-component system nitrogen regulation sensor histidine kinase NtrY